MINRKEGGRRLRGEDSNAHLAAAPAVAGPKISVILAVFNAEKYLEQALASIFHQSYDQTELVVIDGGSTDRTIEILKKQEGQIYYWVSEPDKGIYDAWNKGVRESTGDWLCFIGSDDYFWNEGVIAAMVPHLEEAARQKIRYVYGKVAQLTEADGRLIQLLGEPWAASRAKFRSVMPVAHCGSFHHRDLFTRHGAFDASFKIAGDYEFLLREFKDPQNQAVYVDQVTVVGMRAGGISGSLDQRLTMALETELARKKNGVTEFSPVIFFWIWRIRLFLALDKVFGRNTTARLADVYRYVCKGQEKRWSK
jgi:glycosyltransferase involved in cell wall biosynthesis